MDIRFPEPLAGCVTHLHHVQVIEKHKAKSAAPASAKKQKKSAAEEDEQQQASVDQIEAEESEEMERPRKKKMRVDGGKPSKRARHEEEAGEKKGERQLRPVGVARAAV